MKKNILLPTDFSENAINAIIYAANLFKDTACDFYLLNTYTTKNPSRSDLINDRVEDHSFLSGKNTSERKLNETIDLIKSRLPHKNHAYHAISMLEDPREAIVSTVAKKDIELVVMGTKGSNNRANVLFGSNTINIMETMRRCPVIGVPMDSRDMTLKEIVFPTNFKTNFKKRELSHLVEIALLHDAHISVLYISDEQNLNKEQEENKKLLTNCLEDTAHSFHHKIGKDAAYSVTQFVESRGSDMIAFINSKHTFFGGLFSTPMVKELGLFSKVPILVMHDN